MALDPIPQANQQAVYVASENAAGQFRQVWYQWLANAATSLRLLTGAVGPNQSANTAQAPVIANGLVAAANDAAAAAAGVPIGGLYRIANAVQIRLV